MEVLMNKKQGGLMEATKRLKAQGLRKGGKAKKARPETKSNKTMTPQEKKELMDKIKKRQGKMTNPFVTLDSLGRPTMEAKKGGAAKKFPDLSGDGKVTMKDILMGRGVVKKPKKKAMGGSMTLKGGKLKGVKDAPEEYFKEAGFRLNKERRGRGFVSKANFLGKAATGVVKGVSKGAGKVAGRAAKRGYGIAKK
tara:strand:+ start:86 stop:670 length:585 start_codon:yes stop_codon:yes gene_type:complete